jgi:DNA-binding LacI/PurR family transcriptional regulator
MANHRVTVRDVAAEANVSIASVSLYLNDKPGLSEATRLRIEQAIKRLGYVPRHNYASAPDAAFIGLLVEKLPFSTFSDMFYGEVIQGMEYRARELGYHIALMVVEPDHRQPRLLAERSKSIHGIIMLGGGDLTGEIIGSLLEEELPAILVDNQLTDLPIDCVVADNLGGAYHATQYLIAQGYKNIAFIQGPPKYQSLVERFRGHHCALFDAGIPLDPDLIQSSISQGLPNKGYREMKALLDRGVAFDAVFCVSDRSAFGALQALQESGLRVPQDVAVIGFDNVAQSAHTSPPLTTIDVPKRVMGDIAIRRLHDLIMGNIAEKPVKNVLYTALVKRDSS